MNGAGSNTALLAVIFILIAIIGAAFYSQTQANNDQNIQQPTHFNGWSATADTGHNGFFGYVIIYQNGIIVKDLKGISNEEVFVVLTYYHKTYGLNDITPGSNLALSLTYQDYMDQYWDHRLPSQKYNISDFAPVGTPVPTVMPTFNEIDYSKAAGL